MNKSISTGTANNLVIRDLEARKDVKGGGRLVIDKVLLNENAHHSHENAACVVDENPSVVYCGGGLVPILDPVRTVTGIISTVSS